jgi:N-dimethylarginine dimethylaminohydrolase
VSSMQANRREYLMCQPAYFDVSYSINPWMDVRKPVDTALAMTQWERLRDTFTGLGHQVHLLEPIEGLPDMVFSANGATVVDGRVLLARFRYPQRAGEVEAYVRWFATHGYADVRQAHAVNEGEGDFLVTGRNILAGTGFRTEPAAHPEARAYFGRPVIGLTLCDPYFYHLDTALAVLAENKIMYYPAAFTPASQKLLARLYPDAILATAEDAAAFGLNVVSDGEHVVLPQTAIGLIAQLRARGFEPIGVDVSELQKAGGAVKCCTLELRSAS